MMKFTYYSSLIVLLALRSGSTQHSSTLRGTRQLQCSNVVDRLEIINAATDRSAGTFDNGDTIVLANLGIATPKEFTVKAITCGTGIGSVKFELDGSYYQNVENLADYLMCGNSGADAYFCEKMTLGPHNLTIAVYSSPNAGGTLLGSKTVRFTVTQLNPAPVPAPIPAPNPAPVPTPVAVPVPSPTLAPVPSPTANGLFCSNILDKLETINAATDQSVGTLDDGDTIVLGDVNMSTPTEFNVKAITCGTGIGSVKFELDDTYYQNIENSVDYLMCGNSGADVYFCEKMTLGPHSLTVTVYSNPNAGGTLLASKSVRFTITQLNPTPVPAHIPAPVPSPTLAPVQSPTATGPARCPVPKLVGDWIDYPAYPFNVLESHGSMIGKDFVILSGFKSNFDTTTLETYALDTTNATAEWRRMDDAPSILAPGFSHSAYALVGMKVYICGGYLGPNPGRDFSECVVYDHSVAPGKGLQWSILPSLPDGRGGGGMVHDKIRNALYFASGADRAQGTTTSHDKADTWMFDLNKPQLGWVSKANIPFQANHMSFVTAKDSTGNDHHFFLGGQSGENEANGNTVKNYEWDAVNETWIEKADMLNSRGHFSSSTRAFGCGFIIAGGTSNGQGMVSDISYYDIDRNTWTKIGDLWKTMNTPICDIATFDNGDMWLYCDGHWHGKKRIKISV